MSHEFSSLTSRRSQPPLALSVPLSRLTSRVGGGSAFYVRRLYVYETTSHSRHTLGGILWLFLLQSIPTVVYHSSDGSRAMVCLGRYSRHVSDGFDRRCGEHFLVSWREMAALGCWLDCCLYGIWRHRFYHYDQIAACLECRH